MKTFYITVLVAYFSYSSKAQNVGIGTPTPQANLEVVGSVRLDTLKGTSLRPVYVNSNGDLTVNRRGYVFENSNLYTLPFSICPQSSSPITVSGLGTAIATSNIQVRLSVTAGLNPSLIIYLQAPNGQLLNLATYEGGGGPSSNFSGAIFTDNASNAINSNGPYSGTYKPRGSTATVACSNTTGNVASFSGFGGGSINPNGNWTLLVINTAPGGGTNGTIQRWAINFENSNFTSQALSANYVTKTDGTGLLANSTIYDNGSVGIGTTSPQATLDVSGVVRATAFNTVSDLRLKTGVGPTHYGLKDLMAIQVADYRFKGNTDNPVQTGFIAQQLYQVFPGAVTKGDDNNAQHPYAVDYSKLTPLLVKAVQDLTEEVAILKATIKRMRAQKK